MGNTLYITKDGEKDKQLRAYIARRRKNASTRKGNRSLRNTVKYEQKKESYRESKEDWMDGTHYVKRLVSLINL